MSNTGDKMKNWNQTINEDTTKGETAILWAILKITSSVDDGVYHQYGIEDSEMIEAAEKYHRNIVKNSLKVWNNEITEALLSA